jgi:xanthine/uracil permease
MKNSIFYTLAFVLVATLTFAQAHRDAVPGEEGIDTISLVVGLVVGVIVGYLIGARSKRK